jgi:hypothetical protein
MQAVHAYLGRTTYIWMIVLKFCPLFLSMLNSCSQMF